MKNRTRKIAAFLFGVMALSAICAPNRVLADREDAILNKPYLSLGADLKENEKTKVLELLGIKQEELGDYTVATVTNADEHEYLDAYLAKEVIGSRALSSVKVVGKESGNGINVTTKNITYCTVGMYQNALVTAGIKDADITVAGPFDISGTAALVGAIKSYSNMTGEELDANNVEAATNELVVTSELAEDIGDSDKAEELIGAVKDVVVANNYNSKEEILEAVENAAQELEVKLSEEDKASITALMEKINDLDLDVDTIKEQAKDLYDKLKDTDLEKLGISQEQVDGFFAKLGQFFKEVWGEIVDFFS